jgi:hypothetical protein
MVNQLPVAAIRCNLHSRLQLKTKISGRVTCYELRNCEENCMELHKSIELWAAIRSGTH